MRGVTTTSDAGSVTQGPGGYRISGTHRGSGGLPGVVGHAPPPRHVQWGGGGVTPHCPAAVLCNGVGGALFFRKNNYFRNNNAPKWDAKSAPPGLCPTPRPWQGCRGVAAPRPCADRAVPFHALREAWPGDMASACVPCAPRRQCCECIHMGRRAFNWGRGLIEPPG